MKLVYAHEMGALDKKAAEEFYLPTAVLMENAGRAAAETAAELLGGGEVTLPRLGKFKSKAVAARKGRNPRTGEILEIPAGKKLVFITCKELKEAMRS